MFKILKTQNFVLLGLNSNNLSKCIVILWFYLIIAFPYSWIFTRFGVVSNNSLQKSKYIYELWSIALLKMIVLLSYLTTNLFLLIFVCDNLINIYKIYVFKHLMLIHNIIFNNVSIWIIKKQKYQLKSKYQKNSQEIQILINKNINFLC